MEDQKILKLFIQRQVQNLFPFAALFMSFTYNRNSRFFLDSLVQE